MEPPASAAAASARRPGATKASKNPAQSRPSARFSCATQTMVTPRCRSSAASWLIGATIPRAAGTSIGAPGATKAFCMSTTRSALRFGSSESNKCNRPRRASTRSTISRRISTLCIEVLGHSPSGILVRQWPESGAEVVLHVLRIAGAGDGAGDCRMRDDPFQEVLRPARDAELGGPRRQGLAFDPPEERAFDERTIGDDGHTEFFRHFEKPLFRFPFAKRIVDLQEVVLASLHGALHLAVGRSGVMRNADIADPLFVLPVEQRLGMGTYVGEVVHLHEV